MFKNVLNIIFSSIFILSHSTHIFADDIIVPAPPKVNSSSYLVMDFYSGNFLVKENINTRLPPASLTKIMTAYVIANELSNGRVTLEDKVLISEKAWRTLGSRMFIEVGEIVKLSDLLRGMVIQSGNDASVALSEHIAGSEEAFADLMNQYARRLGMANTNFVNSTGLPDDNHYTTAHDLAILSRALIKNFPEIHQLHSIKEFTYNNIRQYNRNKLLWRDPNVDGIKTGHTEEAGYCLVASTTRDNMRLISVIMRADSINSRFTATHTLFNYIYHFFETYKLYSADDLITSAEIWKADQNTINLGLEQDLYITVPRGQYDKLEPVIKIDEKIIAPVNNGDQKGVLNIILADETLATVPLLALQSVSEGNIVNRFKDQLLLLFK